MKDQKYLQECSKDGLRQHLYERVHNHPYIKDPHPVFASIQESGDLEILLRYTQEQPPISHQFLIALGQLGINIIDEGRKKGEIRPKIPECASYVISNLLEELKDPKERRSHLSLLADFQCALQERKGKEGDQSIIKYTRSESTAKYEEAMTKGMTDIRTGLLYLAVMETWMRPEYDILEIAATKAGVPKTRQKYLDANRDADEDHVVISIEGALKLAYLDDQWNIHSEELEQIVQQSCEDRAAFWDQFVEN